MGEYYHIVNPAKRQYLSADKFGEGSKARSVIRGYHGIALAALICNFDQVRNGSDQPRHGYGALAGTWFGDRIYLAGDGYGQPNDFGIQTSTDSNPGRNLYWMAMEEFEDISYRAIAMLCEGGYASELAHAAADPLKSFLLKHLGNVVFRVGCTPLENALAESLGSEWTRKYKEAREK
jgi:hypothetical protein